MSTLSLTDVTVTIGDATILTDVSVRAASGTWLGIVGPNGAGKSTLLHAACGVLPATGVIELGGDLLGTLDRRARAARVALVPQTPVVPPGMTVLDYVLLGRTPHRGALGAETHRDRVVAHEVLRQLDLVRFAPRVLTTLSGGERQRVFLARALAQQSAIVLLDEPTAALDIAHQVDVLHLIDQLRRDLGLTIVTTLHDLTLAGRYPDALVMLTEGRVVAAGPPGEVLTPAIIEQHFGTPVRVLDDESGLVVVPVSRAVAR